MTADELCAREAIRHTLGAYNIAGDANDVEAYAATFTDDGVLEGPNFRIEGRKQILAWKAIRAKQPPAPFVRHHLGACQIELTAPDAAKARTYFLVITDVGPDHNGYYLDIFQKVDERWLIAHREVRVDWKAETSLFRSN